MDWRPSEGLAPPLWKILGPRLLWFEDKSFLTKFNICLKVKFGLIGMMQA